MPETVLKVRDLTKVFRGREAVRAVDGVSFEVKKGEIVGLLGPNGAGKTTTIQMLLGTTKKTAGKIVYFGKEFGKHREEILQKVNYGSAYTRLPWRLTVKENLMVYAGLYGVRKAEERIRKLLAEFEVEWTMNKVVGSLSSGQLTRVILVKAFINYPELLLLDEPTASLDPDIAVTVRRFLLKQQKKYRVAILFTSHK